MRYALLFLLPFFGLFFSGTILSGQENSRPSFEGREEEIITPESKDLRSLSLALGLRTVYSEELDFDNRFLNIVPDAIISDEDFEEVFSVRLSYKHGLDNYLIPGISLNFTLEYFATTVDLELQVIAGGNVAFAFDDELLTLHSIGFSPMLELRFFPLLNYLLETSLPTSWGPYLYGGPKLNFNIYDEGDLDLDELDTFVATWELGGGVEVFISDHWSLQAEVATYNNKTDFVIEEGGQDVLSGDIDFQASRFLVGVSYYF